MRKLGNYPYFNTLFSIVIAIFLTGVLSIFSIQVQKLTTLFHTNLEIQLFLDKDLSQEVINKLENQLSKKPYLATNIEPNLYFISKTEAAQKMIDETGENFIDFLGENPLHDAFFIYINKSYSAKQLKEIKTDLEKIDGVFEVVQTQDILIQLNKNLNKISIVIGSIILLFLVVVFILINNAIRLALFSQRFLIRSMKLVGATDLFIKRPFLLNATKQGYFGGGIASLLVLIMIYFIDIYFSNISILKDYTTYLILLAIICLSILITVLSTYFAAVKYLKMDLDELY